MGVYLAMKPDDRPWILGRQAMIGSLVVAHIWGTLLVIAVLRGSPNSVIGDMFSTVGFMIFSVLGVLVGGKAWKDFAPLMSRNQTQKTEETSYATSTTVSTEPVGKQE